MKNKIPPPILLLIFGTAMWFVAKSGFAYPVPVPLALIIAIAVAVLGVSISLSALHQFAAVETTVNPLQPEEATSLVQGGIFGKTRNPMYVGLSLVLTGWAIWLESLGNIAMILIFVLVLTELQVKPEETAMRKLFGNEYEDYCKRVGRWF